jgi:hypothetical protein
VSRSRVRATAAVTHAATVVVFLPTKRRAPLERLASRRRPTHRRFIFHDVAPGVYLLDVLSANIAFSQVKISLPASPVEKVRCLEYKFPGAQKVRRRRR